MVCINTNPDSRSRARGGSLALLARLLDGAGRPVKATDVASVRCSIREFGSHEPDIEFDVDPCDVILPTLVTEGSWTVDDVGYNFRHDLANVADFLGAVAQEFSGRVEVRYVFTLVDCAREVVSFYLRLG